jgi:ABC-type glycerol-3-phosphate transport system permease component
MRFRAKNLLLAIVSSLMVLPPVVLVLPLFLIFTSIGLVATYQGAIIVYAGLCTPFSVYMLVGFFQQVPNELIEAASLDGASTLAILLRIVVPLARPALATLLVVNAVWVWNDLLIPLVLMPKDELRTLMVGVTIFGTRYNTDVPLTMAGMLIASLPMLLLYLLGQRYLIRGLTAGALKG